MSKATESKQKIFRSLFLLLCSSVYDFLFYSQYDVVHFIVEVQETGDKNACQKNKSTQMNRQTKYTRVTKQSLFGVCFFFFSLLDTDIKSYTLK